MGKACLGCGSSSEAVQHGMHVWWKYKCPTGRKETQHIERNTQPAEKEVIEATTRDERAMFEKVRKDRMERMKAVP